LIVAATSRLARQIEEVVGALNAAGVRFALIGGLALAAHKVVRATRDVDLLIDSRDADEVDRLLAKLGYQRLHRSADAGNHLRGDERVDLLYAGRAIARRLLTTAAERKTSFGLLRVVNAEGLIGFKLQGFVNDSRRTQDLEDIRALLRANKNTLDMKQVREYFRLFDRESLLEQLLHEIS
jgi:predicted nucleotidyltransferase